MGPSTDKKECERGGNVGAQEWVEGEETQESGRTIRRRHIPKRPVKEGKVRTRVTKNRGPL